MSDFIPSFRPRKPVKLSSQPWLNPEEPQVILFQGMRGSGKGVAVDSTAEKLYNEGFLILHIWAARSFENLYWAINKNCREHYKKMKMIADSFFEKFPRGIMSRCLAKGMTDEDYHRYLEIMKEQKMIEQPDDAHLTLLEKGRELHDGTLLHCKCHKAYPISWIVPEYIEINQDGLDRFNGKWWKSVDEYDQSYEDGKVLRTRHELMPNERKLLYENRLEKPEHLWSKPLIIVRQITPPTTKNRKEVFREQFTKIALEAREQRRVVVMNPAIFEGQTDKFETLTEIFRMIPYLMNKSGHFTPLTEAKVGKTRKYWTKHQKNFSKVAIVINELRSVAPSSKLSPEKDSGKSKKAIVDYIPEARHMKTHFIGDYQNPEDLYSGVRHQANVVVIKRASRNILGNDWSWLFDKVIKDRFGFLKNNFHLDVERPEDSWQYERIPQYKDFLDYRRPKVDDLPDNCGYITYPNNEIKLERFEMPSFHHKESFSDFKLDTGIEWTVNMDKKPKEDTNESNSEQKANVKKMRMIKEEIYKKIAYMRETEDKSWQQIKEDLVSMEKEGIIPNMEYAERDEKYFSNRYGDWKRKQSKSS